MGSIMNRLTVAEPVARDSLDRPAHIPEAVLKKRLKKAEEAMEEDDDEDETKAPRRVTTTSLTYRRITIFRMTKSMTLYPRRGRDTTSQILSTPTSWRSWRPWSERRRLGRGPGITIARRAKRTRIMKRSRALLVRSGRRKPG